MTVADPTCVNFGAFRLHPRERLLLKDGTPVAIGSRALDILIALTERAGEVVPKRALMARVWPDTTVEDSNLRVHIASLRRALGETRSGPRVIVNVAGRGYSFVGSVETDSAARANLPALNATGISLLPRRGGHIVGRDSDVAAIRALLTAHRFVTIHGPGGIGKTTVGLAVAESVMADYADGVYFVDLGMHQPGTSVADLLAATLGLFVQQPDAVPNIVAWMKYRRLLVVLDCCEHVIESATTVAEAIFRGAPNVSILATSRERLRADGERVYALTPLEAPPDGQLQNVAELLRYPAAMLFHDRAVANGLPELSTADVPIVAEICRKVDGIALALELAASRVGTHGLEETAALLESRFNLMWRGRRTAPPRQQTLYATIDWSHALISAQEQTVLRRLSLFAGAFAISAAQAVASDASLGDQQLNESIEQLVDKSLVLTIVEPGRTRYRLLDTTRAYARAKLEEWREERMVARKHAEWCRDILAGISAQGDSPDLTREDIANVHAALEWCFSASGDVSLGIELAIEACAVFVDLTMLRECRLWAERALDALQAQPSTTIPIWRAEMSLRSALGHALMFIHGPATEARPALERAMALAREHDDVEGQFRLLAGLHMHFRRAGKFAQLLPLADEAQRKARELGAPPAIAAASAMFGVTYHLLGNLGAARSALVDALQVPGGRQAFASNRFGFHGDTQILLARTLWLQGFADQALAAALESESMPRRDPVSECLGLIWSMSLRHWSGAWLDLEALVERLISYAGDHSLEPYRWVGVGFRGEILIRRGDTAAGVALIRQAFETLQAEGYTFNTRWLGGNLANGLSLLGDVDRALATMDLALAAANDSGAYNLADLRRLQGDILARAGRSDAAQRSYETAISLSDTTGALAWRLRAVTGLARLWQRQGRKQDARSHLAETYGRFTEGFDTADLNAARMLLDELGPIER